MRLVPLLAAALGVVALAVGAVAAVQQRPASFGWTAYSPLSGQAYVVSVGAPWWAVALVGLGGVLLGAGAALLIARRR